MDQDERDFILESAQRKMEHEDAPRPFVDPYSDMTSEEKSKLLILLQGRLDDKDREVVEQKAANAELNAKLDKLVESQTSMMVSMAEMTAELKNLRVENAALRKLNQTVTDALNRSNQAIYGNKSQKSKTTKSKSKTKSRDKDKDDFDGTAGSIEPEATIDEDSSDKEQPAKLRTEAQLKADILRTGSTYRKMGANKTISHPSDLSRLPKDAVVIKKISQYAYEQTVSITEHEYEIVVFKLDGRIYRVYLPENGDIQYLDRIPGTKASADMMAHLATNRFLLDVPLYRELGRLSDEGMRLSRKTLTNWLHKGSLLLSPIVEELKKIALEKDSIINCDETWCRVKVYDKYRRRYIWCLVNKEAKIVIYCYEDGSRGRKALKSILGGAELKALQSDGYNVYLYLDNEMVEIDHICCLAHARAKFMDAARAGDKDAEEVIGYIMMLYAREKTYTEAGLTVEQIGRARKSPASLEIVGLLRSKLNALLAEGHPPRGELMEKAIRYLDTFWKQIFLYLENGRYSIDNNIAERNIRPLAGERKNSLFFGSDKMARASAIYHTVISTCRMMGLSAIEYIKKFFRKIVEGERDYGLLMPHTIGISVKEY